MRKRGREGGDKGEMEERRERGREGGREGRREGGAKDEKSNVGYIERYIFSSSINSQAASPGGRTNPLPFCRHRSQQTAVRPSPPLPSPPSLHLISHPLPPSLRFLNPAYVSPFSSSAPPSSSLLTPITSTKRLVLWESHFFSWQSELHDLGREGGREGGIQHQPAGIVGISLLLLAVRAA